jgi:hypothetical protein
VEDEASPPKELGIELLLLLMDDEGCQVYTLMKSISFIADKAGASMRSTKKYLLEIGESRSWRK